ncbi:hypothetical protein M9Y10_034227 [Tritrichomonas musculus]|uniref:BACK domain-containing protein n=1 Tax=Tritrichomonas musculus TaxID=1915356 RepID=A0ABR2KEE1_9EUKA
MDQSFRKDRLMLGSFNPGLTREEISKIVEPFGPIQSIKTYRRVVNNMMYNLSLVIIHFGSRAGYDKALHSDPSQLGLSFIEIDPFFMRPHVAFIFGLPRPENLAVYTKIFSPLGAKDIRMIEKSTCKNDYILVSTFDNKSIFRNFIKVVDNSYMSGNLIRVFPFNITKASPTYFTSMHNLKSSINNPQIFDFKLLYYDKEYKCWSGSAIANCDAISNAYNKFLIDKGENPNQEEPKTSNDELNNQNKIKKPSDKKQNENIDKNEETTNENEKEATNSNSDNEEESGNDQKNSDSSDQEEDEDNNNNSDSEKDEDSINTKKNNKSEQIYESNEESDMKSKKKSSYDDSDNNDDMTEFVVPQIPGPFEIIVDYINGKAIQLSDTNAPFIMIMSAELGMTELNQESTRFVYECSDLESNAVMLGQLYELNGNITPLLSIIANKFEEICDNLTVRRFPSELLEMIISSPFFSIRNEDKLFEYIQEFKKTDIKKYQYLLKQVRIERLSSKELLKIVSDPTIDLNTIREGLLLLLKVPRKEVKIITTSPDGSNLQEPASSTSQSNNSIRYPTAPKNLQTLYGNPFSFGDIFRSECFKKEGDNLFNGIFAALRNLANGQNPATAGLVNLIASSEAHEHVEVLLDHDPQTWFGTQDTENSFIRIDFKTRKVSLVGYSLKTHSHEGNGHITGWSLSGSNDNDDWTLIDSMPMTDQFDSLGAERYYQLNSEAPYYRYFELKQTRQNTMGYHNLRLSGIEFFGSVQQ